MTTSRNDKQKGAFATAFSRAHLFLLTACLATTSITLSPSTEAETEFFNKRDKYQFYKWVDEWGNVHYSQTPPKEPEKAKGLQRIKANGSAPSGAKSAQEALQKKRTTLLEKAEARKLPKNPEPEPPEAAAIRKKNCETAKANLAQLKQGGRVKIQNDDGELEYLDDTARQSQIELNQKYTKEHCSK